jgi:uncharacterized protein YkwD
VHWLRALPLLALVPVVVVACGGGPSRVASPRAAAAPEATPVVAATATVPTASPAQVPATPASAPRAVATGSVRGPRPVPATSPQVVAGVLVGSTQQRLTNQARAAAGLPPLAWSACLAGVASRHAMEMAVAGAISHGQGVNQDLACNLGSRQAGENVGDTSGGADDQRIFDAFMKSPGHRANVLGPYRFVATAWVIGTNGTGYVSVEFG